MTSVLCLMKNMGGPSLGLIWYLLFLAAVAGVIYALLYFKGRK